MTLDFSKTVDGAIDFSTLRGKPILLQRKTEDGLEAMGMMQECDECTPPDDHGKIYKCQTAGGRVFGYICQNTNCPKYGQKNPVLMN